jgi:hypothetical protein
MYQLSHQQEMLPSCHAMQPVMLTAYTIHFPKHNLSIDICNGCRLCSLRGRNWPYVHRLDECHSSRVQQATSNTSWYCFCSTSKCYHMCILPETNFDTPYYLISTSPQCHKFSFEQRYQNIWNLRITFRKNDTISYNQTTRRVGGNCCLWISVSIFSPPTVRVKLLLDSRPTC